MKLASLKEGQFVETGGYYTKGDAGQAKYLIVAAQAADGYGDHTLANGTVAVLQVSDVVTPEQVGVISDWNGTTGTDNGLAWQAFITLLESGVKGSMSNPFKISTGAIATLPISLSGIKGKSKVITEGNITGLHVNLAFISDPSPNCMLSGFEITNTGGFAAPTGRGLELTNVIRSSITDIKVKYHAIDWYFSGESFSNNFTRCESADGVIGWRQISGTNNNNTFTSCVFKGQERGSWWSSQIHAMVFTNCDHSSLNDQVTPNTQHVFSDVSSIVFNGGYAEGTTNYKPDWFYFNSLVSTNGSVLFNGYWFKGTPAKDGVAIRVEGNVDVTLMNPWFNGFDIGFLPTGTGEHLIYNPQTAITNNTFDFSGFTGEAETKQNGRTNFYSGNVITAFITATGTLGGSSLLLNDVDRVSGGTGAPEGVLNGNVGDLYMRSGALPSRDSVYVKDSGTGTTGWIRLVKFLKGATSNRPTGLFSSDLGLQYYDTDLDIPIFYSASGSATNWSNALGVDV